jgi:hypothetical protein
MSVTLAPWWFTHRSSIDAAQKKLMTHFLMAVEK